MGLVHAGRAGPNSLVFETFLNLVPHFFTAHFWAHKNGGASNGPAQPTIWDESGRVPFKIVNFDSLGSSDY